jgi:hypothetical protein
MGDWVVCPHCRLRHSLRADMTCPRCKKPVEHPATPVPAGPGAPRLQHERQPPRPASMPDVFDETAFARVSQQRAEIEEPTGGLPLGVRLAGAILLVNGMLQLALGTIESAVAGAAVLAGPWLASFDIVVGAVLLSDQDQVWRWARVRVLAGGGALILLHLVLGRGFDAGLQILFCGGLLLLLPRDAAPWRLPVGAGAATIALVLALTSVAPFMGWKSPVSQVRERLNGEIGEMRETLSGSRVGYEVDLTPGEWHALREPDRQERETDEPQAEGGLTYEVSQAVRRPVDMLDVRLFALQAPPDASFDTDEVMGNLVDEARDGLPEFLVTEDDWHRGTGGATRVLEGQARIDGQRTAVAVGLKIDGACVFMLVGTAPVRMYARVRDDLLTVYTSLRARGC